MGRRARCFSPRHQSTLEIASRWRKTTRIYLKSDRRLFQFHTAPLESNDPRHEADLGVWQRTLLVLPAELLVRPPKLSTFPINEVVGREYELFIHPRSLMQIFDRLKVFIVKSDDLESNGAQLVVNIIPRGEIRRTAMLFFSRSSFSLLGMTDVPRCTPQLRST